MDTIVYLKIFAGLGLFFVGINQLSEHLKSFGKPYVGKIIDGLAGTDLRAIASGALAGGVTNSGKAVTFALAGIVASGVMTVRRALPVIVGASFGSSLLVLWVSIDFKYLELLMLGVAGLYYQFGDMKKSNTKFIAGLVFGLGMIFYGLDLLKGGAAATKDSQAFLSFISSTHGYWLLALILGAIAAFVTQSGSTISIVAITFTNAGILDFDQTIMFVYGTNIGSGVSTAMLGMGMAGTSRQLVMFHAAIKVVGSLLLIPMLYIETYAHLPFIKAFSSIFAAAHGTQVGVIYVVYEVLSGVMLLGFFTPAARLLATLWPPTQEEALSRLHHISRKSLENVDHAIVMIEKEQTRLLHRAPRYLDMFRMAMPERDRIDFSALHEANKSVQREIHGHITELLKRKLSPLQTQSLLQRYSIQEWLTTIDTNLYELVKLINKNRQVGLPESFIISILQSLDTLLESTYKSLDPHDLMSAYFLVEITEKRETLLGRFKPRALAEDASTKHIGAKKALLEVIVHYERLIWIINKMAHTLTKDLDQFPRTPNAHVNYDSGAEPPRVVMP